MTVSNIIAVVCCVLTFGAMIWAMVNEFGPESKDESQNNTEEKDREEENHE